MATRTSGTRRRIALGVRGRSPLVWGAILYLAGTAGLFLAMEGPWPHLRDPEFGLKLAQLKAIVRHEHAGPLILAMGSSHTGMGLRPDSMLKALSSRSPAARPPIIFNMAVNSAGPVLFLVNLRRLLAAGIKPDVLLLEVWPITLQLDGTEAIDADYVVFQRRLQSADLSVVLGKYDKERSFLAGWLRNQLELWHAQRSTLVALWAKSLLPEDSAVDQRWAGLDEWGFQHLPGFAVHDPERYERFRKESPAVFARWFGKFHVTDAAERSMRVIMEICRREGIAVVLVRLPEASEVRGAYTPELTALLGNFLDKLTKAYPAPFIDAKDWMGDDAFGDPEHMAASGADEFSRRFAIQVLAPLLNAPPDNASGLTAGDGAGR